MATRNAKSGSKLSNLAPEEVLASALRAVTQLQGGPGNALFPHGINELHLRVDTTTLKLEVRLVGASNSAKLGDAISGTFDSCRLTDVRLRAITTPGIDVSHHNGSVNWTDVAASNQKYVFIKATEGSTFQDPRFSENWAGARIAGLLRGAYHYFRPNVPVADQVDNFTDALGSLEHTDMPPVLDLEERSGWNLPVPQRATLARNWLIEVHQRLHCRPIVYTSKSFMQDVLGDSSELSAYPLWVAHYTGASHPQMPSGWTSWTFWQYSDAGTVPGITGRVDLNRFAGSLTELQNFIANQHSDRLDELESELAAT